MAVGMVDQLYGVGYARRTVFNYGYDREDCDICLLVENLINKLYITNNENLMDTC
jgi:hypothetical protein